MGCTNSRLDRFPAVSLCRDRCHSLDDALRQSYALADAHVAYLRSHRSLGGSLGRFVSSRLATKVDCPRPDHGETPKHLLHTASPRRSSSSSTSGCHIHFNSDSDDDDHQKLASTSSPLQHIDDYYNPAELSNPNFDRFVSISYQRNQPTQSSMYIQSIYGTHRNQPITADSGLKPQQPAPPPPPPINSTWDFLNFFDEYGAYEQPLGSSGSRAKTFNSDMDLMSTMVPTVAAPPKIVASETGKNRSEITTDKSEKPVSINPEKLNFPESANEGGKYLNDVVKEVESLFEKTSDSGTAVSGMLDNAKFRYRPRSCAHQLSSKVLQAISSSHAKLCLKLGNWATSSSDTTDQDLIVGSDEDDAMVGSRNLTSILNQLYMWEKKLYSKVKDEEMLRIIYSKKCKEVKRMIEKEKQQQPGDAIRIESDYSLIKKLSTRLKISLRVIETISSRITKLRDEELCSCLCQLIYGWLEMWSIMADCHRRQRQAIAKAKAIEAILSDQKQYCDFEHLDEAMHVKLDLQNLELSFCKWMIAQKGCIEALDCWLTKCLSNEPEVSPSLPETGVPAVFVLSRQWMHAVDVSWVMHVTGTMSELVDSIGWVCDDSYASFLAKAQGDKELELKMKMLERKDRKMRAEIRCAIKRGVIPTTVVGLRINDGELGGMSGVRPRLENMFEAMAKYSANCVETYKELSKFCDEKHLRKA